MRAVAKGARKPNNTFSARLELYSVADVLMARGKSLDIVKEARLVESNERVRLDVEHAAAAAPMAELLACVTASDLENPRLFDLTTTALSALGRVEAAKAPSLCAAHLLKTFAFCGLRPSFGACVSCGRPVEAAGRDVWFSCRDGGIVCPSCRLGTEALSLPAETIALAQVFLYSTFVQLEAAVPSPATALEVLQLCQQWSREHVGVRLKSLDFLFTCGVY